MTGLLHLSPGAIRAALAGARSDTAGHPNGLKPAAVLIGLVQPDANSWQVILTRRTTRVELHKGQVALPGGAAEVGDGSPVETALREAEEEIGLPQDYAEVLGVMPPFATLTSFLITPVVAVVRWPFEVKVSEAEVERVFCAPLGWLANPANREERLFARSNGREEKVYFFNPYGDEVIWGITAQILVDFLELLK